MLGAVARLVRRAPRSPATRRSASSPRWSSARWSSAPSRSPPTGWCCAGSNYDPEATIVATIGLALHPPAAGAQPSTAPRRAPVAAPFSYRILLPWFGYSGYKLAVIAVVDPRCSPPSGSCSTRTRIGLVMRATQYDRETAQAFGIRVDRVYAGVFGARRHARRHRRRADRADQPGALPDGRATRCCSPSSSSSSAASAACAAPSSPPSSSASPTASSRSSSRRRWPRSSRRCWSPGAGLPPAGPVRTAAGDDGPGTARTSAVLAPSSPLAPASCCRAYHRDQPRPRSWCSPSSPWATTSPSAMPACSASATPCSSPPASTPPASSSRQLGCPRRPRAPRRRRRRRARRRSSSACWRCAPPASPS